MSVPLSSRSLARLSARRPWAVLGLWALLVVAAALLSSALLADVLTTQVDFTNAPESKRGFQLLEERLRGPRQATEIVIVRSPTATVEAPAFRQVVERLYAGVMSLGPEVVVGGYHYYQTGFPQLVSADRRTTILPFTMAGRLDDAVGNADALHQAAQSAAEGSSFEVLVTGEATAGQDFRRLAESDLQKGEAVGVPVALIILLLVFGAAVAALIPLVLAVVSIAVAVGATALVGQAFDLSFFVVNMITMMGLAVGIDYSLFVVSRYREERRRGLDKLDAITVTGATASRTVFFSGMTVVCALLGLLAIPETTFRSLAVGAILVVMASVVAALTLLPAILSLLGDRIEGGRIPLLQSRSRSLASGQEASGGFWEWSARAVMRRPIISLVATVGLLLAAGVWALQITIGSAGIETFPDSMPSKKGFLVLEQEFSGGLATPVEIVVVGDIASAPVQGAIQELQALLRQNPLFGPAQLTSSPAGDLALLSLPLSSDAFSVAATDAVRGLRANEAPRAFAGVPAEVLVTGLPAQNADFFDMAVGYTPIVFAVVLSLSFVLLTVFFRSIVVPVKAILMNLLSVGAAYGLVVLVTQKGFGADLLGFQRVEAVEAWIPMFLFAMLFGLSMDYHVFLLSRIRERYDQTGDNSEAVYVGLRSTARIITGAALIMVVVFVSFAAGDLSMFQQLGFGLGVAVLLDATVVRSVLVPATMRLLGNANWYLPRFLRWLPRFEVESRP